MTSLILVIAGLGLVAAFTSPGSVVTVIVLLSMSAGVRRGLAFICGRLIAIALIGLVIAFFAQGLDFSSKHTTPSRTVSAIEVLLGGLLLIGSARAYRHPRHEEGPTSPPKWLDRVEGTHWSLCVVVGAVMLSYTLTLAAAAEILKANVDAVGVSVAALVFAVLSGILIAAPVAVVIFAPDRSNQVLASLRAWLLANTRSIVLIVLMAVGGLLVIRGAYDLWA
jgi:hypothetical protein